MKTYRILKISTLALVSIIIVTLVTTGIRYGGGKTYPDISTEPLMPANSLEVFYVSQDPIGNVAVSAAQELATRFFFTIHPESRPEGNKLLEIKDGIARPYPSSEFQKRFDTPLGCIIDRENRLWVIDHGNHGLNDVRLFCFDLDSDALFIEHVFPDSVAPLLSFFNDLSISRDGKSIAIANVSFWGKKPSIVLFDIESKRSKMLLENHPSMRDEGFVPETPNKKMSFFGGLASFQIGVDGIDFSPDGRYLYWAPMSGSGLYRIPAGSFQDVNLTEDELELLIERVAHKPLSDGIKVDLAGNIYITDIENQGVYLINTSGEGVTLIRDERVRWADGLALGNDGYVYLADSDIPNLVLQSKAHIDANAPFYIFRFKKLDV